LNDILFLDFWKAMFFRDDCPNRRCLNLTSSKTQAKMTKTTTKQFDRVSISLQKKQKILVVVSNNFWIFSPRKNWGEKIPMLYLYVSKRDSKHQLVIEAFKGGVASLPSNLQVFDVTSEAPLPRCLRNNGRPVIVDEKRAMKKGKHLRFHRFYWGIFGSHDKNQIVWHGLQLATVSIFNSMTGKHRVDKRLGASLGLSVCQ